MSIAAYPKPGPRLRGRPKNSGVLKHPDDKSTHPAKLSPELIELVRSERRHNESVSDTIIRLIRHKVRQLNTERKKVDALSERLQWYECNTVIVKEVIKPRV